MKTHRVISVLVLAVFTSAFIPGGAGLIILEETTHIRQQLTGEVISSPISENVSFEIEADIPLEDVVDKNGKLNLPAGKAGSIDLTGWQMDFEHGGSQRFVPQTHSEISSNAFEEYWEEGFYYSNHPDERIFAMVYDGSGNLYIGGEFTTIGSQIVNHVAKWDAAMQQWYPLGSGIEGDYVYALTFDEAGNLYVGGYFSSAGSCSFVDGCKNIARWDPAAKKWSSLGAGMNSFVNSLVYDGSGTLYAGGWFNQAGTCDSTAGCNNIARYDLSSKTWDSLGSGTNNGVESLAWDGSGNLYAGGYFQTAGACNSAAGCNYIAKWNTGAASWSSLGSGTNGLVEALTIGGGGILYAGGGFSSAGICNSAAGCNHIASWNPTTSTWSALKSGVNDYVFTLKVGSDGKLYAGGNFNNAGTCDSADGCNQIAVWNSTTGKWSPLGSGADSTIFALEFDNSGLLVAGGEFLSAGKCAYQDGCIYIAYWKPAKGKWSSISFGFGLGTIHHVNALAFDRYGNLYAGGHFWAAGTCSSTQGCNHIAKWDRTSREWSSLGTGMDNTVYALAMDDAGNLYAGGSFERAGNCDSSDGCSNIAMWDQTANKWSSLASGVEDSVETLYFDSESGYLYAGGSFEGAGSCSSAMGCNNVARWDPAKSKWSALGTGVSDDVEALIVGNDGVIYAGGDFDQAGDCDSTDGCNYIAMWDKKTKKWLPLGTGMDDEVNTLVVDDKGDLYAGGGFETAGGCSTGNGCNNIARWRTSKGKWFPLGSGMPGIVDALAWDANGYLYAGGYFKAAGECSSEDGCNNIAMWDSGKKEWSPLDTGMDEYVFALVTDSRNQMFAGGNFSTAGDTVSNNIARWIYGELKTSYLPVVVK